MDEEKFEAVYRKYRSLVLNAAYEVLHDYHLAQDVCQEVFIKISDKRINAIENIDSIENIGRYLNVVASNRAKDYLRSINRRLEFEKENGFYFSVMKRMIELDHVENKVVCSEAINVMFDGLREKNEEWYQIVIGLRVYEESSEVVARRLGISNGLLRSKMFRATKWLHKNFKEELELLDKL